MNQNDEMSGSSITPPKGRATRPRNADSGGRSVLSSRMQWAIAIAIGLVVLGAALYLGRDVRSDLHGSAPNPPPSEVAHTADR